MKPGSVVTVNFPGVTGLKRRPVIVVSTATYHIERPDVILAVTTNVERAKARTDYLLKDWAAAGLRKPSAARIFLGTRPAIELVKIGELSARDWIEVQKRLRLSLEF